MSSSQLTFVAYEVAVLLNPYFLFREMVKDISDLPPRIEQRMFVGKSMKLHPPTQNGHGTPLAVSIQGRRQDFSSRGGKEITRGGTSLPVGDSRKTR